MAFQLSSVGAGYEAVITASFTYRSSRGLRLAVTPHLTTGGDDVSIASSSRPLAPSPTARTATVTWIVHGLDGSLTYGLNLWASVLGSAPSSWSYSFTDINLVVEGSPA